MFSSLYPRLLISIAGAFFLFRPIGDPDLGWHLVGGEYISRTLFALLSGDISDWSLLVPRRDWINSFRKEWHDYHWLSQLLFSLIYDLGGFLALKLFLALLGIVLANICFDIVRLVWGDREAEWAQVLLTIPSIFILYNVSSVRPQVIAFIAVALTLRHLITKSHRYDVVLPLGLGVITANVHVYWVLIPCLWFIYRCLPRILKDSDAPSPLKGWGGLTLLSCAGLISPYGILGYPLQFGDLLLNYFVLFDYLLMGDYLKIVITEFQSPFAGWSPPSIVLGLLLLLWIRLVPIANLRTAPGETILALTSTLLMCRGVKFAGIFAICILPSLARAVRDFEPPLTQKLQKFGVFTLVTLGVIFTSKASTLTSGYEDLTETYPIDGCRRLSDYDFKGRLPWGHVRVVTFFDDGGWCRWVVEQAGAKNDIRVSTDGRTQELPEEHFEKSFKLLRLREGWIETLAEWDPDAMVLPRASALAHLPLSRVYSRVHIDDHHVTLVNNRHVAVESK